MRLLRIVVSSEHRGAAAEALERTDMTFIVIPLEDTDNVLFELPVPSNAVAEAFDTLEAAGVDLQDHTIVASAETALTPTTEKLEERYVGEYEPLTGFELRTKARDLSRDKGSYAALMILSALIATAGLLMDAPAIVVGSMVIAPIIGPALTASVGSVTGDGKMIVDSLWMQVYGLAVAVGASALLAAGLRFGGFVPAQLELGALDLVGVRIAPNALSIIVGLAAGTAAGIGLTTKGPTSIIGVMIAAALIPTAGVTGISIAWADPTVALGSAALLVVTMVLINVSVLTVLVGLKYHRRERPPMDRATEWPTLRLGLLVVFIFALTVAVIVGTVDQTATERTIENAVGETLEDAEYENLQAVSVQTEYGDASPFTGPRTVTVTVAQTGPADTEALVTDLAAELEAQTDESVLVQVETVEYVQSP